MIKLFLPAAALVAAAAAAGAAPSLLTNSQTFTLPAVGKYSRAPIHRDPVEASLIAHTFQLPSAGASVTTAAGKVVKWSAVSPVSPGHYKVDRGGYTDIVITRSVASPAILNAGGDSLVYVNGVLFPGDVYGNGQLHLPIYLRAGRNDLLFLCIGRNLSVDLSPPRAPQQLSTSDLTLPDLHAGKFNSVLGAIPVLNTARQTVTGCTITVSGSGIHSETTAVPPLLPLEGRKCAFRAGIRPPTDAKAVMLTVTLRRGGQLLDVAHFPLAVRSNGETYKQTFISHIDGSVQYFAVNPAKPLPGTKRPPALVLTLHGAGVEAIGQVNAYESKSWATLVGPTNRRPFGFDWEDWGRLDALEVLHIAQHTMGLDNSRTYLAGHSMGGHGTWQLGVLYPDRFAAIGPSAAWISFATYGGMTPPVHPTPMQNLFDIAGNTSNTLLMGHNYAQEGIYILQGLADDTVPPSEAKHMVKYLSTFHKDFRYHFQPGANHWWDVSPEPGADCVDYRPMYQFFAHHVLAPYASMRHLDFTTTNPGVTARDFWLTIEQQLRPMLVSNVNLVFDPGQRLFHGTTTNVAAMRLDLRQLLTPDVPVNLKIDSTQPIEVSWPKSGILILEKTPSCWNEISTMPPTAKNPLRNGPFKLAFNHRFMMVYGTHGTPAENRWALEKARLDAETFWYRGNGSVDIVPDSAFHANQNMNRSVILYGNSTTNSAWKSLLSDSPVQVAEGNAMVGAHQYTGTNLACLFLQPRPGSSTACVAAIAGSGLPGMEVTDRLPIFMSGTGWPDCTLLTTNVLNDGINGVLAAGFFGNDWSVVNGTFAFK